MRKNATKILLGLFYPEENGRIIAKYDDLRVLVKGLSASGFRALISRLQTQGYIQTSVIGKTGWVRATELGIKAVEAEIPALSEARRTWSGKWSVVIFLEPPKADAAFRYLRSQLLSARAWQVSRGVYALPGKLPPELETECHSTYSLSVVVTEVSSWNGRDLGSIVMASEQQQAVIEGLSGTSKEVDDLLVTISTLETTTHKQKTHIFSVFDRLVMLLKDDFGISHYYFPQLTPSWQLLQKLQQLYDQP